MRCALGLLATSLLLTTLSGWVPRQVTTRYPDIMGCERGCQVAAGGWPVPFVVDYPGISPVGSVSISGGLMGEDRMRWGAFAASWALWLSVGGLAIGVVGRSRRGGTLRRGNRAVL